MEGVGSPGTPESPWRIGMDGRIKPNNNMVEQSGLPSIKVLSKKIKKKISKEAARIVCRKNPRLVLG